MLRIAARQGMLVPPDSDRRYVDKHQFKDIFREGAQADDHGFSHVDPVERAASNDQASYYSFSPKSGIRYIVLDTVSESGKLISPGIRHRTVEWPARQYRSSAVPVAAGRARRGTGQERACAPLWAPQREDPQQRGPRRDGPLQRDPAIRA